MTQTIKNLERLWTEICRYPHHELCTYYQELHRKLVTARETGEYCDGDQRKIQAMLDDVENRMNPNFGFPGGSTAG